MSQAPKKVQFEFCITDRNHDRQEQPRRTRPHRHSVSTTSTNTTARRRNVSWDDDPEDDSRQTPPDRWSQVLSVTLFVVLIGGVLVVMVAMFVPFRRDQGYSGPAIRSPPPQQRLDCGCPQTCGDYVLGNIIGLRSGWQDDYTCRDRIEYFIQEGGMNERMACEYVSNEFPTVCGPGCRPSECAGERERDTSMADGLQQSVSADRLETTDVCPELIWQDDFDGSSLDATHWEYQLGDGCDLEICSWGNGELQIYQQDNLFLDNGTLVIEARNESGVYTSGRIRTKGLVDFQYGYVEASIRVPRGQGLWAAFWALPTDEVYGRWPQSGEMDVMEHLGHEPNSIHGSIHYANSSMGHEYLGDLLRQPTNHAFAEEFHRFAMNWEEDRLQWFVDGGQYSEITPQDLNGARWPFKERFHLLLNLAVGGGWPGNPDSTTRFPQRMTVDYVRIYDKPFGRLLGPTVVSTNEPEATYALQGGLVDYTLEWSVPEGASFTTIDSETSAIVAVQFGTVGGHVTVVATSTKCGSTMTFYLPVQVVEER